MLAGMSVAPLIDPDELQAEIAALDEGRAFVERTDLEISLVSGRDARVFLGDLVTADVASLEPHAARPSLLLTPTGRIRAAFHLLGLADGGFALAQGRDQPERVSGALEPYVLSSDVAIGSSPLRLFSIPGRDEPPPWAGRGWRPGLAGTGVDLLVAGTDDGLQDVRGRLAVEGLDPARPEALEVRRIRRGEPRFPVDLGPDALPAEAGWEDRIDLAKGCFLGQEAVAKVRNLGHPPHVVLALRSDGAARPGEEVLAEGEPVGRVTSAASSGDGWAILARVRHGATQRTLSTASGRRLSKV